MRGMGQFLKDTGKLGIASVVASVVSLGMSVYEHLKEQSVSAFLFLLFAVVLFCFGCFKAWKKEYDANRTGPDILLTWFSGPPWAKDKIRFRNLGIQSALDVSVGNFSWPELYWCDPNSLSLQAVHPGDNGEVEKCSAPC